VHVDELIEIVLRGLDDGAVQTGTGVVDQVVEAFGAEVAQRAAHLGHEGVERADVARIEL
jgi:hypothetical protein